MTTLLTKGWVVATIGLGFLVLVIYLATASPGRSQALDATVSITSTEAVTNSQATVSLSVTPEFGSTVGALRVVVTYDNALLSALACTGEASSICNAALGPDQVGFAAASVNGISGSLGTITFSTLAFDGVATLSVALTTCADVEGFDLTCATVDGEIIIMQPTPSPTPSPPPTPSPTPTPPPPTASPTPFLPPRLWGDVNCDGIVNAVDALAILRKVAGLPVFQVAPCPTIGAVYPQPIGGK